MSFVELAVKYGKLIWGQADTISLPTFYLLETCAQEELEHQNKQLGNLLKYEMQQDVANWST